MTQESKEIHMLVGSLSNDLFRVASMVGRGSTKGAKRFLQEAKRWADPLKTQNLPQYILMIAKDISARSESDVSQESAEQYLMYGVRLQNYALHMS